jgi:hypothetical protein
MSGDFSDNHVLGSPIKPRIDLQSNSISFQSIAEDVKESKIPSLKFENSKRKANCFSLFTYWYANTLVESVKLNKGKMASCMIEDMNTDPRRDEKVTTHFETKLLTNFENWKRSHPE